MAQMRVKILGTGMHVPKQVRTNFDLEKMIDTTDQWIFERSGIRQRRISDPNGGEFPSDLAHKAALMALKNANLQPDDIDLIIFATTTPDYIMPNTASVLQTKLGMKKLCGCVDLAAACSGFIYGFNLASSMIETGALKHVLVVGAEMLSRIVNWNERSTCILFGDGCGAFILGPSDNQSSVLSMTLGADGLGAAFLRQPYGGTVNPITKDAIDNDLQYLEMNGKEMFKVAVRTLADNATIVIEKAGLTAQDVTWVVPHQANIRIIEATANRLDISMEKVIVNIENYGNTSAATIPMAFHEAVTDGRIKRGDVVLIDAFGAGLTSGATLFRY